MVRKYMRKFDRQRYEALFSKYAPRSKKPVYRIYLPLVGSATKDVAPPPEIFEFLNSKGIVIDNYKAGLARMPDGRRTVRIGKVLAENPVLKKMFDNDAARSASKVVEAWVVVSRHPYDIIGMSFDRGWTSCMNLKTGEYKEHLKADVEKGTLVAYLVANDDKNINRPTARISIKPFSRKGQSILVPGPVYGTAPDSFERTVQTFCVDANRHLPAGNYKVSKKLYDDLDIGSIFHATVSDVESLKSADKKELADSTQDADVLDRIVESEPKNLTIAYRVVGNSAVSLQTLNRIFDQFPNQPDLLTKLIGANSSDDALFQKIIRTVPYVYNPPEPDFVRLAIARSSKASATTLKMMVDEHGGKHTISVLRLLEVIVANPNVLTETVVKIFDAYEKVSLVGQNSGAGIRLLSELVENAKTPIDRAEKYASSNHQTVRLSLARNPKLSSPVILKMIRKASVLGQTTLRTRLLLNPNLDVQDLFELFKNRVNVDIYASNADVIPDDVFEFLMNVPECYSDLYANEEAVNTARCIKLALKDPSSLDMVNLRPGPLVREFVNTVIHDAQLPSELRTETVITCYNALNKETFDKLWPEIKTLLSDDQAVRLLQAPYISSSLLDDLSLRDSVEVKIAVLAHYNCTFPTAKRLMADKNQKVRKLAKRVYEDLY